MPSRALILPSGGSGSGSGTVTNSAGALTASALIVGNAAADVRALADLGTTTKVLHGNAAGDPTFGAVSLSADVTGTLGIGNGGTGQTGATAAFDALAPTTTQGDVIYRNASNNVRLGAGTSGQFLQTLGAGANPQWASQVYTLMAEHGSLSPTASTTYFWGSAYNGAPSTTAALARLIVPKTGVIRRIDLFTVNAVRDGSNESSTLSLRVNNTTDTQLSNTLSYNLGTAPSARTIAFTGLAISVTAGDYLELKWATAAWTTTPQAVVEQAVILVETP